jgi:hypothetical protein
MEEKEIGKPLILEIEEAKLEMIQCINNAMNKLPCYIVDMILSNLSSQVKEAAKSELNSARQQMNNGEEVA